MSEHYTSEGDFQDRGEAGDTLHAESKEHRKIVDAVMLSVDVADDGKRTMRVRETYTSHRKDRKAYETIVAVRTYVTEPGSPFVTMHFNMNEPSYLVGRADVGRHGFPALKRAHAAHVGQEVAA